MIGTPAYSITTILLLLTLYFSSKEDIKYHRISKKYVIIFFLIVMIYNTITVPSVEKTMAFLITLGIFTGFTFATKGGFGFGDTLILGAIGWFIGDLIHLQYFFITLAFCTLILESYFIITNHKEHRGLRKKLFNNTKIVKVEDLKPGMILANDYFMKGLTEQDIMELKKASDTTIKIKQAYPFIPIIFASFLLYVMIAIAYYLR